VRVPSGIYSFDLPEGRGLLIISTWLLLRARRRHGQGVNGSSRGLFDSMSLAVNPSRNTTSMTVVIAKPWRPAEALPRPQSY